MPLLNYTTKIPAAKTAGEIQEVIRYHGAKAVLTEYGDAGEIVAISFKVETGHGLLPFPLPVNTGAVLAVLKKQFPTWNKKASGTAGEKQEAERSAQAERVAWRILKTWVEAQMALLETEMVTIEEIFLPYLVVNGGKTLYNQMSDSHFQLKGGQ
jgi:hypothetical protein